MPETANETINFSTLVMSFGTAALMHLGVAPAHPGEKLEVDLGQARTNIEILKILKKKCEGNLTAEEDHLLQNILTDLQFKYSQKKSEQGSKP